MAIVAERYRYVVGVDTHAKTHTYAIVDCVTGEMISSETFPVTAAGILRALSWVSRRTKTLPGAVLISMEGTGSYGAQLRQRAVAQGFRVTEAPFPQKRLGRYRGKSDPIHAGRAAKSILGTSMDKLSDPETESTRPLCECW